MTAEQKRKLLVLGVIWSALLTAPYWMAPLGGYTALATRVLVLGLAAMSVNFLLGFTGVLSFGHAAYFGLGAYGAGLSLKFLAPSTPLSLLLGMLLGGVAGALLGALIVRRRGVYFAMVTIAFGQVFYYIAFQWSSLTGGDDGLRGFSRQPLDLKSLDETGDWSGGPFASLETESGQTEVTLSGQMNAVLALAEGQILTDDFAPVDNLLVPVFMLQE